MTINYNCTGECRKQLVQAISRITGVKAKYLGAPSFAYQIGCFRVDKNGNLCFDDCTDSKETKKLIDELADYGFTADNLDKLTVEIPDEDSDEKTHESLKRILDNKHDLICHALGCENLDFITENGKVKFPWFTLKTDDDAQAYCRFVTALVKMAKEQKRINNKPCKTANEKYTMRCFLLRLGFIGREYKTVRTVLLRNLSGCSAFRDGRKGGGTALG